MKNQKVTVNPQLVLEKYRKKYASLEDHKKDLYASYLYIIFSLITLSFFGIFAIKPTLSTISSLNQQLTQNKQLYAELQTKSTTLKSLDVQYQRLTPDLPIIFSAVPRSTLMAYLTRQVETMTARHNLNLSQLTFGTIELYPADKDNPPLYSFTFNAVLVGDEERVKDFIAELIQFDRLVNLEQLNTGNQESGDYGVTVTGKVYFSKL